MTWYSVRIFTVSLSKDLSPLHYHVRETCLVVKVSWDRGGSGQRIRSCPSQSSGWSHWLTPLRPMKSAMGPLVIAPALAPKVSMEPNNEYCKQTHQQTPKNKVLKILEKSKCELLKFESPVCSIFYLLWITWIILDTAYIVWVVLDYIWSISESVFIYYSSNNIDFFFELGFLLC